MIIKRIWMRVILLLCNTVFVGTHCFFLKRVLLNSTYLFEIGDDVKIVGPVFITCKCSIGKSTWIGRNFQANGNGVVCIGANCDIAPDVSLYTGGHEIGDAIRRAGKGKNGKIVIGDGSWICAAVKMAPDVTIGQSCVIAAGAVVTKDIPADSLAGGIPARMIRKL